MQQLRSSASKRVCLILGRPFVKRICYRTVVCLSVLFVYDVGVLWPNGCMDYDKNWQGGRHRPWPHCFRWGPSSSFPQWGTAPPIFGLCHAHSGQTAGWINMPLDREVRLGPGDIVLDGDPAPLPKWASSPSPTFRPMSTVGKRIDGSRCHFVWR